MLPDICLINMVGWGGLRIALAILAILWITDYTSDTCDTIIHFIETRLQNTIVIIINILMGWLTGWLVIL